MTRFISKIFICHSLLNLILKKKKLKRLKNMGYPRPMRLVLFLLIFLFSFFLLFFFNLIIHNYIFIVFPYLIIFSILSFDIFLFLIG